jgi:hypothetical protein
LLFDKTALLIKDAAEAKVNAARGARCRIFSAAGLGDLLSSLGESLRFMRPPEERLDWIIIRPALLPCNYGPVCARIITSFQEINVPTLTPHLLLSDQYRNAHRQKNLQSWHIFYELYHIQWKYGSILYEASKVWTTGNIEGSFNVQKNARPVSPSLALV